MPSSEFLKILGPMHVEQLKVDLAVHTGGHVGFSKDCDALATILDDHDRQLATIRNDPKLSLAGRDAAAATVTRKTLAAINQGVGATAAKFSGRIAPITETIRGAGLRAASPVGGDPQVAALREVVREIRAAEIRASVRALHPAERHMLYLNGDLELQAAIESAPPLIVAEEGKTPVTQPWVDPDVVTEVISARGEAVNPEAAKELRDFRALQVAYTNITAAAKRAIDPEGIIERTPAQEA